MRSMMRRVWYCDYCKTRRMTQWSMFKHESSCTNNPNRTCGWVIDGRRHPPVDLQEAIHLLPSHGQFDEHTVDWLREYCHGCPACMLAVFRQSGKIWEAQDWSYKDEVQRLLDSRRKTIDDEYDEMYGTPLTRAIRA